MSQEKPKAEPRLSRAERSVINRINGRKDDGKKSVDGKRKSR